MLMLGQKPLDDLLPRFEGAHKQIIDRLDILVGLTERMLDQLDDAFGMPRSDQYTILQASPAQNTLYNGETIPNPATCRHLTVTASAACTLTVYLVHDHYPSRQKVVWRGQATASQATVTPPGIRFRVPAGAIIAIATDTAAIAQITLSASIDAVEAYPIDWWRGRS